jgi:pimeloyl-ACP methyl ester carboxylesterase
MIYREPVIYEIKNIKTQVLLIVGENDRTTIGRNEVDNITLKKLGNYPVLSKNFIKKVKNGELLVYKNTGHIPHLENKEKFNSDLLKFLMKKTN